MHRLPNLKILLSGLFGQNLLYIFHVAHTWQRKWRASFINVKRRSSLVLKFNSRLQEREIMFLLRLGVGPSGRACYSLGLRPLAWWDCGFRIPPRVWMSGCCECCVLSGRGLCDEMITRPEEFYWLWCVVVCDLETSRMVAPYIYIYIYMTLVT